MSRDPACATGTVRIPSPLGELLLVATPRGLTELRFCGQQDASHGTACPNPLPTTNVPPAVQEHLRQAHRELDAYFDGRLRAFSLALDVRGTPFQRRVWQALQDIPYGETWSYAMLAAHIGRPSACRAVGNANGKTPSPSSSPAIGSSMPTAAWEAIPRGSASNASCLRWNNAGTKKAPLRGLRNILRSGPATTRWPRAASPRPVRGSA